MLTDVPVDLPLPQKIYPTAAHQYFLCVQLHTRAPKSCLYTLATSAMFSFQDFDFFRSYLFEVFASSLGDSEETGADQPLK